MKSVEVIKQEFPLHWLVWNDDHKTLQEALDSEEYDKEKLDPRGRTPLMLAVKLSYLQSVKCLLAAKCNAIFECEGWSVVQEAVCAGNSSVLTAILEVRDLQRHQQRVTHVPKLLQLLLDAPDFYVEMKWEFTSWVPLMSKLCPSDVYKVYKRGSNVRFDTTLLGFENATWIRGNRTYIFKGQSETATMVEIDHDTHEVLVEELQDVGAEVSAIPPPAGAVRARLNTPVTTNNIDMDKISFERNRSGIWGWRSEKTETINGYECKVYGASNVEFITRTRTEHLRDDQATVKSTRTPLHSFLGLAEDEYVGSADLALMRENAPSPHTEVKIENGAVVSGGYDESSGSSSGNNTPKTLTLEEYFSDVDLKGRDVGRPRKVTSKIQRFKANLWLSEDFPIKLQEQVLPILDLMSTMASPHVSKLKDFICMQLPSGFPVKVEIPLFHVLNACVTFGNVFATETSVPDVSTIKEDTERLTCVIDDRIFDIPSHYVNKGHELRRQITIEDEDDLLQFAIEQSLMENNSETEQVDIWEALRDQRRSCTPGAISDEDAQLQRVLQDSLSQYKGLALSPTYTTEGYPQSPIDPDLAMAMRLSEQEQKQREIELQKEQEMIEQVLRLSLEEK